MSVNETECRWWVKSQPFRGSALYTPSTSVHIVTWRALNRAPIMAAEKSLPSLFKVVGIFWGVLAMKPVAIIISDGFCENHFSSLLSDSMKSGSTWFELVGFTIRTSLVSIHLQSSPFCTKIYFIIHQIMSPKVIISKKTTYLSNNIR